MLMDARGEMAAATRLRMRGVFSARMHVSIARVEFSTTSPEITFCGRSRRPSGAGPIGDDRAQLYQNFPCEQLALEAQAISARAATAAGVQDQKATGDAVAMTVGLVVFWPALFFMKGDGAQAAEVGRLKGRDAGDRTRFSCKELRNSVCKRTTQEGLQANHSRR